MNLTEEERMSAWFGLMVARRYEQRSRQAPGWNGSVLAALSASDVWTVCAEADNPVTAIREFLALEESLS